MIASSDLQTMRISLNHGAGQMPALGFGTLIPDPAETKRATTDALEAGFRHFDCAERYRNESAVGEALQAGLAAGRLTREELFVTTKLWKHESPARARRTRFRGKSWETWTHLSGSLSHPYAVCVLAGRQSRSAGPKRQCHLRFGRDIG